MKVITEDYDNKSDPQNMVKGSSWLSVCPRKMTASEEIEDEVKM